jgi:hypothetical protein
MYNQDEQGRRRSARNQGLPPSPLPQNAPLDLLTDENHRTSDSNDETNAATLTSHDSSQNDNAESYDLLTFDPIDHQDNDDQTNSSNFLSSTSSPLYDNFWHQPQQHYQHTSQSNWSPMQHQNDIINPTIIELQNTIRLLNSRLGMLESTTTPRHITSTQTTQPQTPTLTTNTLTTSTTPKRDTSS